MAFRQLDQHDTDILGHGQDHLAQAFRLRLLPVGKIQLVQFGDAVHELRDLVAELTADILQGNFVAVLHGIMQQTGRDGGRVDHQFRQDAGDQAGMDEIRLSAFADLAGMRLLGKMPGFFHELVAVAGVIFLNAVQHLIQGHRFISGKGHGFILLSGVFMSGTPVDNGSAGCHSSSISGRGSPG